jgi:hypothetical protein
MNERMTKRDTDGQAMTARSANLSHKEAEKALREMGDKQDGV